MRLTRSMPIFVALTREEDYLISYSFEGKTAPVAQLDRVPGFGPGGWRFEPSRVYFSPL